MYQSRKMKCNDQYLMTQVVDGFLKLTKGEKVRKKIYGNFRISDTELSYETTQVIDGRSKEQNAKDAEFFTDREGNKCTKEVYLEQWKAKAHETIKEVIALKLPSGVVLGNSSILPSIGAYSSYGHRRSNREQTTIQKILVSKVKMIPFTVFEQAGLDISTFTEVDRGIEEKFTVKSEPKWNYKTQKEESHLEERHFTGASLFTLKDKDGKTVTYLFDVDRREIENKIFNPFLSVIPKNVNTIKDAYDVLRPKEVIEAEKKGLEVKRQGEWFFIPTKIKPAKLSQKEKELLLTVTNDWQFRELEGVLGKKYIKKRIEMAVKVRNKVPRKLELRAGQNRPNTAKLGFTVKDKNYVSGEVTHSGREHAPLKLDGYHLAIPNTAVKSFTITGNID